MDLFSRTNSKADTAKIKQAKTWITEILNLDEAEITKLIQQRNEARKVKDYAQSDRIRE